MGIEKENFFDEMSEKYPQAMDKFKEFIDKYKSSVEWDKLFDKANFNYNHRFNLPTNRKSLKFHDLPFELQFGVLVAFIIEATNDNDFCLFQLRIDFMKRSFERALQKIN